MIQYEAIFSDVDGSWKTVSLLIGMGLYSLFLVPLTLLNVFAYYRKNRKRILSVGLAAAYVLSPFIVALIGQSIEEDLLHHAPLHDRHLYLLGTGPVGIAITVIAPLLPPALFGFLFARWLGRKGRPVRKESLNGDPIRGGKK